MDQYEYAGFWWIPENPDEKISGTIKFNSRDGAELKLIGALRKIKSSNDPYEEEIILGILTNGKKITLYKCYRIRSTLSIPGIITSVYEASVVLMGHHFEKEADIVFDSITINYSYLEEWVGLTGFHSSISKNSEGYPQRHEIAYNYPEEIEICINNLKFTITYHFRSTSNRINEYKMSQTTLIKIEPTSQLHIHEYIGKICYHIQNFLSLGVGRPVYPILIKGKNKNCYRKISDKIMLTDISIFYPIKDIPSSFKQLNQNEMFFSYADIRKEFTKVLSIWFNKADVLGPVYDLYFGTLYNSSMYLQHEFLSLAQALESFHSRIYKGQYLLSDDYSKLYNTLVNAIPENIDENYRGILKEKLKYLNEFSLRKRLKDLMVKCGDVLDLLIKNKDIFIEDIVNTRNYLTHYSENLETKAKADLELFDLVEQMKYLMKVCFLVELEIPLDKIKALLMKDQHYLFLSRQS